MNNYFYISIYVCTYNTYFYKVHICVKIESDKFNVSNRRKVNVAIKKYSLPYKEIASTVKTP